MRLKEIIGRKVIDSSGNEVGEVEDVEFDWDNKTLKSIIIEKESAMQKEVAGKLLSTAGYSRMSRRLQAQ